MSAEPGRRKPEFTASTLASNLNNTSFPTHFPTPSSHSSSSLLLCRTLKKGKPILEDLLLLRSPLLPMVVVVSLRGLPPLFAFSTVQSASPLPSPLQFHFCSLSVLRPPHPPSKSISPPAILVYVHAEAENFFCPPCVTVTLMQRINIVFFWATSSPSQSGRHLSITPQNPVNCISGYRLCTLTLKRLVLSRPLGSDLGSVVIAVKMQVSLPILVKKTRLGDSCQWLSLSTQ